MFFCASRREKTVEDADRMSLSSNQFYVRSPEEMCELFAATPEAISNTADIADRCDLTFEFGKFYLPKFEMKKPEETLESYLERKAVSGLEKRFPAVMKYQKEEEAAVREKYNKRLRIELEIIEKNGVCGLLSHRFRFYQARQAQ